jgi:hypothetical protein
LPKEVTASVKNQWFADRHDYFKYDLWLEVAKKGGRDQETDVHSHAHGFYGPIPQGKTTRTVVHVSPILLPSRVPVGYAVA